MIVEIDLHEPKVTSDEGVLLIIEDARGGLVVEVAIVADAYKVVDVVTVDEVNTPRSVVDGGDLVTRRVADHASVEVADRGQAIEEVDLIGMLWRDGADDALGGEEYLLGQISDKLYISYG